MNGILIALCLVLAAQAIVMTGRIASRKNERIAPFAPLIPISQVFGILIGLAVASEMKDGLLLTWVLLISGAVAASVNPYLLRVLYNREVTAAAEAYAQALCTQVKAQEGHLEMSRLAAQHANSIRHQAISTYDRALAKLEDGALSSDSSFSELLSSAMGFQSRACAHLALNALLTMKTTTLAESGIELSCACNLPQNVGVPAPVLCAIAGNLIDNAAQAAGLLPPEARRIDMHAGLSQGKVIIRVENEVCPHFKLPDKQRSSIYNATIPKHGWGLRIVESLAAQHHGLFSFKRKGNRVIATVVLFEAHIDE